MNHAPFGIEDFFDDHEYRPNHLNFAFQRPVPMDFRVDKGMAKTWSRHGTDPDSLESGLARLKTTIEDQTDKR